MYLPSGDQSAIFLASPEAYKSSPGPLLSTAFQQRSIRPRGTQPNAILLPSGDQRGPEESPLPRGVSVPRAMSIREADPLPAPWIVTASLRPSVDSSAFCKSSIGSPTTPTAFPE